MKNTHIIILLVVLVGIAIGAYSFVVKPALDDKTVSVVTPALITRPDLAFEFSFPSGEQGYSLIEQAGEVPEVSEESEIVISTTTAASSTSQDAVMRHMFLMMDTETYTVYQAEGATGAVPPAISIIVFDNSGDQSEGDRMTRLKNWALQNSALTAYSQVAGEPENLELDGVNAIRYQATTGDYRTTFTLASYQGNIYVFAGQFTDDSDDIKATYNALLESVRFY